MSNIAKRHITNTFKVDRYVVSLPVISDLYAVRQTLVCDDLVVDTGDFLTTKNEVDKVVSSDVTFQWQISRFSLYKKEVLDYIRITPFFDYHLESYVITTPYMHIQEYGTENVIPLSFFEDNVKDYNGKRYAVAKYFSSCLYDSDYDLEHVERLLNARQDIAFDDTTRFISSFYSDEVVLTPFIWRPTQEIFDRYFQKDYVDRYTILDEILGLKACKINEME